MLVFCVGPRLRCFNLGVFFLGLGVLGCSMDQSGVKIII